MVLGVLSLLKSSLVAWSNLKTVGVLAVILVPAPKAMRSDLRYVNVVPESMWVVRDEGEGRWRSMMQIEEGRRKVRVVGVWN